MKDLINKYCDLSKASLLEIGAYNRPTFTKEEADIKFLDVQPYEKLVADATCRKKDINSIEVIP